MAVNMWENSMKNVEYDNNKNLYETLLDIFYSEAVLTFWMRLVNAADIETKPCQIHKRYE